MSQPNDADFESDPVDVSTGELPTNDDDDANDSPISDGPAVDVPEDDDNATGAAEGAESDADTGPAPSDNEDVPDVSFSEDKDRIESTQQANELFNRLVESRSATDDYELSIKGMILPCEVDLTALNAGTRWDCLSVLPDGMFRQASGDEADQNIELGASTIPDGEGFLMLREVVIEALSTPYLGDGDLRSIIENDFRDDQVLQTGLNILVMAMDRGQVEGFRFGGDTPI